MTDDRERWALILGASSGMGEATVLALAEGGLPDRGIHLDFRAALAHVEEVKQRIVDAGSEALYINMNAADDEKRAAALEALKARFDESRAAGRQPYVRVVMHSLAFGSLVPFVADDPKEAINRKKMEMTQDVMANSLVYWVQDLYRGGFLERGSKVYAMTSEGSSRVVPSYGVVSGGQGRAGIPRPPARDGVRPARHGHRRQLDPGRGHRSRPRCEDPREPADDRRHAGPQPARPDDDDTGRRRGDRGAVGDGLGLDQRQHHQRRRRRVRHRLMEQRQ